MAGFLFLALLGSRLHLVRDAGLRPTLDDGDLLLVDLVCYRLRGPYRGEIVVEEQAARLGRVIAIGGDRVDSAVGGLQLNGAPLREAYVQPPPLWEAHNLVLGVARGGSQDTDLLRPPMIHLGTGREETLLVPADCVLVLPDERWRAATRPTQPLRRSRELRGRALYLMAPMERRTWLF